MRGAGRKVKGDDENGERFSEKKRGHITSRAWKDEEGAFPCIALWAEVKG